MNKDSARKIRNWFPRLFNLIARNFLFLSIVTELDRPKYLYSKLTGQPYFGGLYLASQTWPAQRIHEKCDPIRAGKLSEECGRILHDRSWFLGR